MRSSVLLAPHIFAIASKRYVLYNLDPQTGYPIIRKASEHGLGHYMPPAGQTRDSWISEFWRYVICQHTGLPMEEPIWFNEVALAQLTISSPFLLRGFPKGPVSDAHKVAPFNFMMVGYAVNSTLPEGHCKKHTVTSIGCRDATPCRFRDKCPLTKLIRPVTKYHKACEHPETLEWWDAHTHQPIRVCASHRYDGDASVVALKTFRDVYADFIRHAESKAADANGVQANENTIGILQPLHVVAESYAQISKEARNLEIAQVLGSADTEVRIISQDWEPLRDALRKHPRAVAASASGMARSQVYQVLDGKAEPEANTISLLRQTLHWLNKPQPR